MLRTRLALSEKQTQVKAQIQMLLKRHGLEKPSDLGTTRSKQYRHWLESLCEWESLGLGARQSLASLLRQLSGIEAEMENLEKLIEQLGEQPRHKPIVEALMKEKGVGLVTALIYRTEIGKASRFRRRPACRQIRGTDTDES